MIISQLKAEEGAEKIRIAVAGRGRFGNRVSEKIALLSRYSGARLAWQSRSTGETAHHLAETGADWLYVATPVCDHFGTSLLGIQSGCNVLCEKPPTGDPVRTARLVAMARAASVEIYFSDVFRYRNAVRRFLADPLPTTLEGCWHKDRRAHRDHSEEGTLAALAYHHLYILAARLGRSRCRLRLARAGRPDRLILTGRWGDVDVSLEYRAEAVTPRHFLGTLDLNQPDNDALLEMLATVVVNRSAPKANAGVSVWAERKLVELIDSL